MSKEALSLLMVCRADPKAQTIHLQIVDVDTGETVVCRDGSFLLRVTVDTNASAVRCLVRHTASGDEIHLQSGLNLLTFIQAHFLGTRTSERLTSVGETPPDIQGDDS